MADIKEWNIIKDEFKDGLLFLGNGSSIAIDKKFRYEDLKKKFFESKGQNQNSIIEKLFTDLNTNNFEKVLEYLYKASKVNKILCSDCAQEANKHYKDIRDGLLETLSEIHPKHEEIKVKLNLINEFIRQFKIIIDLNYDLLVYWALMTENEEEKFNDLFGQGGHLNFLNFDFQSVKKIIVYPHGNLAICKSFESFKVDKNEIRENEELKISGKWGEKGNYFNILYIIKKEECLQPIFVAEGESDLKKGTIKDSQYLRTIFFDFLPKINNIPELSSDTITFLGFSFGKNDEHIFEILSQDKGKKFKKVAISYYEKPEDKFIADSSSIVIENKLIDSEKNITFFNAETSGWPQNNG